MGLLDEFSSFVKTPEGQGLLSAAFGGLATARRGEPINSMGKAGLAGLMGYGQAQDRIEKNASLDMQKQVQQMQLDKAKQEAADLAAQRAFSANVGQYYESPAQQALAGGGGPTNENAAKIPSFVPKFNVQGFTQGMLETPGMMPQAVNLIAAEQAREEAAQNNLEKIRESARLKAENDAIARQENAANRESFARLAAGMRQPVAPTMTEIIDPKNPKQLLRVDAKTYRGGSLGDAGVLGVSGKEPVGAAKENKVENGKIQLAETLDQIQSSYDELHRLKGIPSQERGTLSNIASSIATSGIGQMAGRAVSTKEQVERDVIKASRLSLLNALKKATGKTAQELNSNIELKTNLDALSDPSQGYEAANRIMDNIRKTYIDGSGIKPITPKTATMADIQETARKSGKSTAEVTAAMKAQGYTIGGN